jgi:hypothetical protein
VIALLLLVDLCECFGADALHVIDLNLLAVKLRVKRVEFQIAVEFGRAHTLTYQSWYLIQIVLSI